jgi:hypothetical protein
MTKLSGYRNMILVGLYLVWCLLETWLVLKVAGDEPQEAPGTRRRG